MQVKDVMTQTVITVDPDDSILRAIRLMLQNKISGLPVVDKANRLVGIITEGDFLRRTEIGTARLTSRWIEFLTGSGSLAEEYVHTTGRKVREVMTADVRSIAESAPLENVVNLMESYHVKRIPVLHDDKLVGIVSRANIIRAVGHVGLADAKAPTTADDMQIRQQLMDHLEKQDWAPLRNVTVQVENGQVTFTGAIFDDRRRDALRVAAENTPGVKSVVDEITLVDLYPNPS